MKTCKTCRYGTRAGGLLGLFDWYWEYATCRRRKFLMVNPVNGKLVHKPAYCTTERRDYDGSTCGAEGKYWESK